MRVETNISEVIGDHLQKLRSIADADKIFREAALNAVVLVSDRVQQRGERTDGTKIESESTAKTGAYSRQYGKFRQKKGRQAGYIDLTFSVGGMMDNYIAEPSGANEYSVGFRGKSASDKAEWNEQRFGVTFEMSQSEIELNSQIINKRISELIR